MNPSIQEKNSSTSTDRVEPKTLSGRADLAEFRSRLTEEYKILQDKIDKIGGFRFTIKGWLVTATIAAFAVKAANPQQLPTAMVSIGLFLMSCFFFYFEYQQVRLSRLFADRARRLEWQFRQLEIGQFESPPGRAFPTPYIVHEIAILPHQRSPSTAISPVREKNSNRSNWKLAKKSDVYFYLVFGFLALAPLAAQHHFINTLVSGRPHQAHRSGTTGSPLPSDTITRQQCRAVFEKTPARGGLVQTSTAPSRRDHNARNTKTFELHRQGNPEFGEKGPRRH